jgi:hemerythrin
MSVGVQKLDDEHKLMIAEITELYSIRIDRDPESIRKSFLSLLDNVIEHFSNEEDHMEELEYGRINDHREVHRVFINDVKQILNLLDSEDQFGIDDDHLNFIARWLGNHILVEDRDYAMYAARRPLSGAAADATAPASHPTSAAQREGARRSQRG